MINAITCHLELGPMNTSPSRGMDRKPLYEYPEVQLRPKVIETLSTIRDMGYIHRKLFTPVQKSFSFKLFFLFATLSLSYQYVFGERGENMQISNVNATNYSQTLTNNSKLEGSPSEETKESAAEKASEAQKVTNPQKAVIAQSTGIGTKVDFTA